jgi:hypothetical protein
MNGWQAILCNGKHLYEVRWHAECTWREELVASLKPIHAPAGLAVDDVIDKFRMVTQLLECSDGPKYLGASFALVEQPCRRLGLKEVVVEVSLQLRHLAADNLNQLHMH